ncbi:hypothetical protein PIB30_114540, partial [Stylosanthes scabra]|nr:hypothetical protein [Stylosanthes scabra]
TGRTLIDVQKGELTFRVHNEKMVINVFEAMQYPTDEETEECMRTDILDMLVKEIQEEDMLKNSNAYYEETFATFSDTNLEFLVQDNKDELQGIGENKENQEEKNVEEEEVTMQKNEEENQKNIEELQEIQSIVQENQLDEVQADSATHMQPL